MTAAVSPVAAFAGLMIGLLVLKMNGTRAIEKVAASELGAPAVVRLEAVAGIDPEEDPADDTPDSQQSPVFVEAARIVQDAMASGERLSQRVLAARLRSTGHRFSNAQLRDITQAAYSPDEKAA